MPATNTLTVEARVPIQNFSSNIPVARNFASEFWSARTAGSKLLTGVEGRTVWLWGKVCAGVTAGIFMSGNKFWTWSASAIRKTNFAGVRRLTDYNQQRHQNENPSIKYHFFIMSACIFFQARSPVEPGSPNSDSAFPASYRTATSYLDWRPLNIHTQRIRNYALRSLNILRFCGLIFSLTAADSELQISSGLLHFSIEVLFIEIQKLDDDDHHHQQQHYYYPAVVVVVSLRFWINFLLLLIILKWYFLYLISFLCVLLVWLLSQCQQVYYY